MADAEDLEGPATHPGGASRLLLGSGDPPGALTGRQAPKIRKAAAHPEPASCLLLGFGDPPGVLIMQPAARIRRAAAHPGPASCLLLSFGDLPRRSDRAAGTEDPEGCNASKLKGACAFQ